MDFDADLQYTFMETICYFKAIAPQNRALSRMMEERKMKKFLALALSAALATSVLTGCGGSGSNNSSAPAADGDSAASAPAGDAAASTDPIKLGVLAPLTGSVSVYGITTKNGIEMAVNEINAAGGVLGRQIEMMPEDEKGEVQDAVNAYNKLKSAGMEFLIGDVTSKPCDAVAKIAAAPGDGTPMLAPTATAASVTQNGENIFRTCFLDPFQGEVMATFAAKNLGAKKVAVLANSSDDYSDGIAKAFAAKAQELGLEVVGDERYGADDQDFKTQLTKINAAGPDVLMLPDYYEKIALIATQARQVGFQGTMLGADGWDGVLGSLGEANASAVDGCYFSCHYFVNDEAEAVKSFVENYRSTYNDEPTAFSALGYDSVYIMKAAMEKAGSTDKAAVVEAMKATDYSGVTGHMTFDENGDPVKTAAIIKLQDGQTSLETLLTAE